MAKSNRRVFIPVQSEKFDISMAEDFGEVIHLFMGHINPFSTNEASMQLSQAFDDVGFDYTNDFLCMTGPALVLSMALAIANIKFPFVDLLLFDATTQKYRSRIFTYKGL